MSVSCSYFCDVCGGVIVDDGFFVWDENTFYNKHTTCLRGLNINSNYEIEKTIDELIFKGNFCKISECKYYVESAKGIKYPFSMIKALNWKDYRKK